MNEAKLVWASASELDITRYKCELDNELQYVYMDPLAMYCNNHMYTVMHVMETIFSWRTYCEYDMCILTIVC